MRTRAGVVLIEDNKVALIERHRAGLEYFVFPGGGVDEGESPEQAAVREAMEELGVEVVVKQKVAEIQIETSRQFYFLVERVAGEFGTGTGEEFTDPSEGSYVPIWMPIEDLPQREKVYPVALAKLVVQSQADGWGSDVIVINETTE